MEQIKALQKKNVEIKKSKEYRRLIVAKRTPSNVRSLDKLRLHIKTNNAKINELKRQLNPIVKSVSILVAPSVVYPPNPAKKRETDKQPLTFFTMNRHKVYNRSYVLTIDPKKSANFG